MSPPITITALQRAIRQLPSDAPQSTPGKWYLTQKEHWIAWLGEYHGPGFYKRKSVVRRDARFAYNHIVQVEMLLWLAKAVGLNKNVVAEAHVAERRARTLQAKAAAVRRVVPWELIKNQLWTDR